MSTTCIGVGAGYFCYMHLTAIADTHSLHRSLKLPGGDILCHAGDITEYGTEEEVMDFVEWFSAQNYEYKVFVAGNHDLYLEEVSRASLGSRLHETQNKFIKQLPKTVKYLNNTTVKILGKTIYGSPITPYFLGMAYNMKAAERQEYWESVKPKADIWLTHSPPLGIMDGGIGCEYLHAAILHHKPRYHIYGHAHEQHGIHETESTAFVNAAICGKVVSMGEYKMVGKVWEVDL